MTAMLAEAKWGEPGLRVSRQGKKAPEFIGRFYRSSGEGPVEKS